MAYFVHFLLPGELIFTWVIFYDHVHVSQLTDSVRNFLTAYSVHIPPMLTYLFYVPPIHDLCQKDSLVYYFVYLLLLGGLFFTFYGYVHVSLVMYSVHIPPLVDLFCTKGSFWRLILYTYFSMFDLFSTRTTSSWPSLQIIDFYVQFCLFSSPWWSDIGRHFMTSFTSLWWPILYT